MVNIYFKTFFTCTGLYKYLLFLFSTLGNQLKITELGFGAV